MKRVIFFISVVVVLTGLNGCASQHERCPQSCTESNKACGKECGGRGDAVAAGPTTGAVAYPYYTTRGPRDFLVNNPQSIGP